MSRPILRTQTNAQSQNRPYDIAMMAEMPAFLARQMGEQMRRSAAMPREKSIEFRHEHRRAQDKPPAPRRTEEDVRRETAGHA